MAAPSSDGFGQSLIDDLRFFWRFAVLRRRSLALRAPVMAETAAIDADPLLARFGDATIAVGSVDGCDVTVRERDWCGWPDPPRYVVFVRDPAGTVRCARDFHHWPRGWTVAGAAPD